jgi:hypothetical protein
MAATERARKKKYATEVQSISDVQQEALAAGKICEA